MAHYTSDDGTIFALTEESEDSSEPSRLILQESATIPSEKKTSPIWWVLGIGMVGLGAGAGYYFYQKHKKESVLKSRAQSFATRFQELEQEENLLEEAASEDTPGERLGQLANSDDWRVRSAVASNPGTPAIMLGKLAQDENIDVRRHVAYNAYAPAYILRFLTQDPSSFVREALAFNRQVPLDVLNELKNDRYPAVRRAAKREFSNFEDPMLSQSPPQEERSFEENPRKEPRPKRATKPKREIQPRNEAQPKRETEPRREIQIRRESTPRREANPKPKARPKRVAKPKRETKPKREAKQIILYHCGPSGIKAFDWLNSSKKNGTIGPGIYFSPIEEDVEKYCQQNHENGTSLYTVTLNLDNKLILNAHEHASQYPFLAEALATVDHPNKDHWDVAWALGALLKIWGPHRLVEKVRSWGMAGTYGYFSDLTEYAILDPETMEITNEKRLSLGEASNWTSRTTQAPGISYRKLLRLQRLPRRPPCGPGSSGDSPSREGSSGWPRRAPRSPTP